MDIQAESGIFSQGQTSGKKCLALCRHRSTGIYALCLVRSRVWSETASEDRLRWSQEMVDNGSDGTSRGLLAQHEPS